MFLLLLTTISALNAYAAEPIKYTFNCGQSGSIEERILNCKSINEKMREYAPNDIIAPTQRGWELVSTDGSKRYWREIKTKVIWGPTLVGKFTFLQAIVACNDNKMPLVNQLPSEKDYSRITNNIVESPLTLFPDWTTKNEELNLYWTNSLINPENPEALFYNYEMGFGQSRGFQTIILKNAPDEKMNVRCVGRSENLDPMIF